MVTEHPPAPPALARALGPALVWAYLAVFSAVAILGVLALVSGLAFALIWLFDRAVDVGEGVRSLVGGAIWVVAPLVAASAVGAAAYGSTRWRSWPRVITGALVALAAGVGLLLIGKLGWAMAGLAAGWGVAIPADRFARIAFRVLPPIGLGLAGPGMVGVAAPGLLIRLLASPLAAALLLWLLDASWHLAVKGLGKGRPAVG